ncbi:hypothetical protein HSB1_42850 [Halogranum salarium B-1]|uniref:Uncharacterized protein n=1 Tax=Halogranum salarium B-1 TaxID=1210908 RepID=J3ETA3_9EURY|nr:hypothetical protein HSB1_42850 [Halogranum salarium B-1]
MDTEHSYDYQFQFEDPTGHTHVFELETHCRNNIGEPRIRWRTEDGSVAGKWGTLKFPEDRSRSSHTPYLTMEVSEPTLVFGRFEKSTPTIFDMPRDSLTLPQRIGSTIRDELEALGSPAQRETVSDDPHAFPPAITDPGLPLEPATWSRVGWNPDDRIMWYRLTNYPKPGSTEWDQEAVTSPRPYQIERGTLTWRKHHITGASGSPDELIDQLELEEIS